MATLIVNSDPAGANIYVDGRDVGAKTPAQVSVDKGQHVVLVRMSGYIDETMNAQFALGQTFNFAPTLRPLGNTDNIKTVGKDVEAVRRQGRAGGAGDGEHSARQPKGAQIAINQHILDKELPGGCGARSGQLCARHYVDRDMRRSIRLSPRQGRQGRGGRGDAAAVGAGHSRRKRASSRGEHFYQRAEGSRPMMHWRLRSFASTEERLRSG